MKYQVLYIDPPWPYDDPASAGERGAAHKYNLMSDADIVGMDVRSIAADDSMLFLWVTFPRLWVAEKVIRRWGFQYKTAAFVWAKTYPKATHKKFLGMGNYTRANVELCLLGVRGRPNVASHSVRQLVESEMSTTEYIEAPIEEHSKKPDSVRMRIMELCGLDSSFVEIFARQKRKGWTSLGNGIDGLDINEAIAREAAKVE